MTEIFVYVLGFVFYGATRLSMTSPPDKGALRMLAGFLFEALLWPVSMGVLLGTWMKRSR